MMGGVPADDRRRNSRATWLLLALAAVAAASALMGIAGEAQHLERARDAMRAASGGGTLDLAGMEGWMRTTHRLTLTVWLVYGLAQLGVAALLYRHLTGLHVAGIVIAALGMLSSFYAVIAYALAPAPLHVALPIFATAPADLANFASVVLSLVMLLAYGAVIVDLARSMPNGDARRPA